MEIARYDVTPPTRSDGLRTSPQVGSKGQMFTQQVDSNGVPVPDGAGITLTDASIANASGSSETIAAASTTRNVLIVSNPSATVSWWINPSGGTAAANTAGSFELPPGAMWTPKPAPRNAVTGIATLNTDLTVKTG